MPTTMRPTRINIDLQQYKEPWLAYCRAHNTTPSEAFRLVVAKLTSASYERAETHAEGEGRVRREIRLTRAEVRAAEQAALREGFSVSRWIAALVRARLEGTPQLGQHELEALARSNLHVLAIGRNLNQIAKALGASGALVDGSLPEMIGELRQLIDQHARKVSSLLESNIARWSAK